MISIIMVFLGDPLEFNSQVILRNSLEKKSPEDKFGRLVVLIEARFIATEQIWSVFYESKTGIFCVVFIIVTHKLLEVHQIDITFRRPILIE